jgi:hypothetical protein
MTVGVYRQAGLGIPLAVKFVGRDRLLWNSMVQGTQRFRKVRAASCVIPYVLCGCFYYLRCCVLRGGLCPPLYIRGDRVTRKARAEYSWRPTTTQSDSFHCTAASSTPIRVITREVRYIHELSLTVEHFMPISSLAAPGLTSPRALRSRVLQASSTWLGVFKSSKYFRLLRGCEVLKPQNLDHI